MTRSLIELGEAYDGIVKSKSNFGTFKRTLFHIHTPESYDYTLFKDWDRKTYQEKSWEDLFGKCLEEKILPETFDMNTFELNGDFEIYESEKEFLSYVIQAHYLSKNQIEIVVVSDHNTIDGIEKLKVATTHICKIYKYRKFTNIISGIEISCADRIHVVGIFEDSEKNSKAILSWIEEHRITEKEGVFLTSYQVMEFFESINGITYMAHLNTSDVLKDEKFLSGGYKKKLMRSKFSDIIGTSNREEAGRILEFKKRYSKSATNIILDNDSHDIESLSGNIFWIKGSRVDFNMLKEAFIDFNISVSNINEHKSKKYIKGLYINYEQEGFLKGKNKETSFCIKFSDSLNCFIGGRGTGKSTVLELLDYILGQNCNSKELLEFLCKHGNAYVLFENMGKEYIVELLLPYKNENDDILRYFGQNLSGRYGYKYVYNQQDIQDFTRKRCLNIYEVIEKGKDFKSITDKNKVLDDLYDTRYSVNELVRTASSKDINHFIYDTMFKNKKLNNISNMIRIRSESGLKKLLKDIENLLNDRKMEVFKVITPFNKMQEGILKIHYSQGELPQEPPIRKWIEHTCQEIQERYNIDSEKLAEYILSVFDEIGVIELLRLSVGNSIKSTRKAFPILEFTSDFDINMVNKEKQEINKENQWGIIDKILESIVSDENVDEIITYLKTYVYEIEVFTLKFNINNKESNRTNKAIFKDVRQISLGQKVVAMLDFILGYGKFSSDYRPIIIDQPEDNLDSQYIYRNLVQQLRSIKTQRQIIIATHNATIVTNAVAENVCVMKSDGKSGWVEKSGYPGERRIKKSIINYMEGGIESFKHKIHIYDEVIK